MARVAIGDADKYGGQGGAGFFQLADNGDSAEVRLMYEDIEDIQCDTVHTIDVVGKDGKVVMGKNGRPRQQYVACLRDYKDSKDVCPFCRENMYMGVRLIIPIYDIAENKVKIWDKGKKMFKKISRLASRHPDIVSQVFRIEREGEAGDQQTDYYIEAVGDPDDTTLKDLPALPVIHGDTKAYILDKTAEDMEYYLQEGQFPPTGDDEDDDDERPVRRRGNQRSRESAPVRRRTPVRHSDEDVY